LSLVNSTETPSLSFKALTKEGGYLSRVSLVPEGTQTYPCQENYQRLQIFPVSVGWAGFSNYLIEQGIFILRHIFNSLWAASE